MLHIYDHQSHVNFFPSICRNICISHGSYHIHPSNLFSFPQRSLQHLSHLTRYKATHSLKQTQHGDLKLIFFISAIYLIPVSLNSGSLSHEQDPRQFDVLRERKRTGEGEREGKRAGSWERARAGSREGEGTRQRERAWERSGQRKRKRQVPRSW